jgi:hypothetical protein
VLYPIPMLLHPRGSQYPKTPKLTPCQLANGIALMMGVLSVLSSSSTKAAKNRIASGVAGRSMIAAGPRLAGRSSRGYAVRLFLAPLSLRSIDASVVGDFRAQRKLFLVSFVSARSESVVAERLSVGPDYGAAAARVAARSPRRKAPNSTESKEKLIAVTCKQRNAQMAVTVRREGRARGVEARGPTRRTSGKW